MAVRNRRKPVSDERGCPHRCDVGAAGDLYGDCICSTKGLGRSAKVSGEVLPQDSQCPGIDHLDAKTDKT
jgi:hypothetical protein